MNENWNEFDLNKPVLLTVAVKNAIFVDELRPLFNEFNKKTSEFEENLSQTSALLARLIARRKNSFTKMKGFKNIVKINSALCRLLRINLPSVINEFRDTLPDFCFNSMIKIQVPLQSNFDYVLVRIMGVHKIHQRIIKCCIESAEYTTRLLHGNFFVDINTLLLAVIAKIWTLSKAITNNYSMLYENLLPFRKNFPAGETQQKFSKDLVLPENLEKVADYTKATNDNILNVNRLQIKMINEKSLKLNRTQDMGVPIDRDSLKPTFEIGKINSIDNMKKFFMTESEKRKKSLKTCVTKRVLDHEWKAIQKLIDRKFYQNGEKQVLNIFRKFMSKKI